MWLGSCQRLITDSSGRFAPFMFGLLLAVSTFSMTMKARVEAKLEAQSLEQASREKAAAKDLKDALETDLLLESTYNSTIDLARARNYLSRSSGQTMAGDAPTVDNQTGTTLDNLARQTSLIAVTDAADLKADVIANSAATTYNTNRMLPTAVFDAQAIRQTQAAFSKDNMDALSGAVLEFGRLNGRLPTSTEISTITSTTGLTTYWGGAFTVGAYLYSTASSFVSPWGSDTYTSNSFLPYLSSSLQTYFWVSAVETSYTNQDAAAGAGYGFGEMALAMDNGTIALGVISGSSPSFTYIFEQQSGSWVEKQAIRGKGASGLGLDIDDDLMLVNELFDGYLDVYKKQNSTWQRVQRIVSPPGANGYFGTFSKIKKVGGRAYIYASDYTGSRGRVYLFTSTSDTNINFTLTSTILPGTAAASSCPIINAMAMDVVPGITTTSVLPTPFVAVACQSYNSTAGIVYIYQGSTLIQTLQPSTVAAGDTFGASVALRWPYLAVGATVDEVSGSNEGVVYVFQDIDPSYTKPNFSQMVAFHEPAAVPGSGCGSNSYFGTNVVFIDARTFAANATCTNGSAWDSTVYIYTLGATEWSKVRTISKTSTSGTSYNFGNYMAGNNGLLAVTKAYNTSTPNFWLYTTPGY